MMQHVQSEILTMSKSCMLNTRMIQQQPISTMSG